MQSCKCFPRVYYKVRCCTLMTKEGSSFFFLGWVLKRTSPRLLLLWSKNCICNSLTYFGKAVLCVKKLDSYVLLFLKFKSSKRKFNKCFWIVADSSHVLVPWILAFLSNSIIIVFSTQSLTYLNVKCYWNNLPENQDKLVQL